MVVQTLRLMAITITLGAVLTPSGRAIAQQSQPKQPPQLAPSKSAADQNDAEKKAEILNSPPWRRAMFEFKEWLSAQQLYTPQQVEQLKARFNERVAGMTAGELGFLLSDMEAKFQILESPQAREAREWMGQYLSVMSDRMRAQVLKDMPDPATMTAAQLSQEIMRIQQKRATVEQEQAAFNETRQAQVNAQLQQDRIARQNYINNWNNAPGASSPYRSSPSDVNERLNNAPIGSGMGFSVGPLGGVSMYFSPSSF
jgi:hypothetical protein